MVPRPKLGGDSIYVLRHGPPFAMVHPRPRHTPPQNARMTCYRRLRPRLTLDLSLKVSLQD